MQMSTARHWTHCFVLEYTLAWGYACLSQLSRKQLVQTCVWVAVCSCLVYVCGACVCACVYVLYAAWWNVSHHFHLSLAFLFRLASRPNSPKPQRQHLPGVKSPILAQFDAVTWTVTFWLDNQGARVNLWRWSQQLALERQQSALSAGWPHQHPFARKRVLDAVPYMTCTPGVKLKFNPTLGATELGTMRSMSCYRMNMQAHISNGPAWIKDWRYTGSDFNKSKLDPSDLKTCDW